MRGEGRGGGGRERGREGRKREGSVPGCFFTNISPW